MSFGDERILLIAPEIINPRSMPCVGLGYIGAYLSHKGLRVRIVDSQFTKEDPDELLRTTPPTLVAIGVDSRTIIRGLRVARKAKGYGHTTLLGGLHVSLVKEAILDWREVDYGIVGDGEVATWQLIQALKGRTPFAQVSGLVYRGRNGERIVNPNVTEDDDLDDLPFPDYRLAGISEFPLYPLVTSRDCPYKCTYCTVGNISHGRFRKRSPEKCVEELLEAKARYNIRGFLVVDENFAVRLDRAYEFCRLLIERKVNLPWTAFEGIRANALKDEFAQLLKASGCRWVNFGIESAENAILKRVEKGLKFQVVEQAVKTARKHGMKVGGFLIVGLPDSSFERDMRTLDWVLRNLDKSQFWMSIPYYGTMLYKWVTDNARLLRAPIGDNLVNTLSTMPYYDTPSYPASQIKKAHVIACLRTGITFFFDQLDLNGVNKHALSDGLEETYQRRLIKVVSRWDSSFLPSLVPDRTFPNVPDPIQLALTPPLDESEAALTNDFRGSFGSPFTGLERRALT